MKRAFIRGTLPALAILVLSTSTAAARMLVVDNSGHCRDARFTTIQSAVDAAASGDRIDVCAGIYRESVVVRTNTLEIFSRSPFGAVIEPPASGNADQATVTLDARGTVLHNFKITGDPAESRCVAGVLIAGSATVQHNRITHMRCDPPDAPDGVILEPSSQANVSLNEISDFEGAGIRGAGTGEINRNVITGGVGPSGDGIAMTCCFIVIQGNDVRDNFGRGIWIDGFQSGGLNAWVGGNRVQRNGTGIEVDNVGIGVKKGAHIVQVVRNGVFDNVGDGLRADFGGPFVENRSLGNGRFDCFQDHGSTKAWQGNIGVTDSPSTLCRAP